MKTKFASTYIFFGIMLGAGVGIQITSMPKEPASAVANLIMLAFAVMTLGYGFKLRKLARKGITDTNFQ